MKLNLGENIRTYRKDINWTQEQLADRLGVSSQSVSRWENGTTYPDMEFLPVMARVFGCTTDDLLGCAEPEKKLEPAELQRMLYDAIKTNDGEKVAEVLRMIRYDYLNEPLFSPCMNIRPGHALCGNPVMMEEYRKLVDAYQERGRNRSVRHHMMLELFAMEDDGKCEELWYKYSIQASCDFTELGLFLHRAQYRGDTDELRHLIEERKVRDLYRYAMDPMNFAGHTPVDVNDPWSCERGLEPGDPMTKRLASETKLKVLHSFSGITADGTHPLSGDGVLDLFCAAYLDIGYKYAAQLAATGECDLALTVLEDWAGLIEQLMDFPDGMEKYKEPCRPRDGAELAVRSPELTTIKGFRLPGYAWITEEEMAFTNMRIGTICKRPGCRWPRSYTDIIVRLDFESALTHMFIPRDDIRASWLNPIRSHGRYRAVVERIHAVIPWRVNSCPHHAPVPVPSE